jgi:hypothetical protein
MRRSLMRRATLCYVKTQRIPREASLVRKKTKLASLKCIPVLWDKIRQAGSDGDSKESTSSMPS